MGFNMDNAFSLVYGVAIIIAIISGIVSWVNKQNGDQSEKTIYVPVDKKSDHMKTGKKKYDNSLKTEYKSSLVDTFGTMDNELGDISEIVTDLDENNSMICIDSLLTTDEGGEVMLDRDSIVSAMVLGDALRRR